jgi:AbrB family looped-hinge helix DNA binding protein
MKGTISSKGQITVPKRIRERYAMGPGTEVEFELREDGALLRKRGGQAHPIWDAIGSLKDAWRWPSGVRHSVDAYVDYVRGGSYEKLTGKSRGRGKRK